MHDFLPACRPGIGHCGEDGPELRHPPAGPVGEVGAGEEGAPVGQGEDAHRPATLTGRRLHRFHVDGVDVGPLLPVDLDGDDEIVHLLRRCLIGEGLVSHHVTPVAGRVADGDEQRAVQLPCPGKSFLAPGVPVDRVVTVLAQVGTGLYGQAVLGWRGGCLRRVCHDKSVG